MPEPRREAPDLDRYLRRVGFTGGRTPTLSTLAGLHLAHATTIPFENLDVRLGRPIRLDLPSLEAKLVARRRGGYCFEQNTLFAAMLRALGFTVDTLEARVRPPGATAPLPRTHMALRVRLPEGDRLADVGFGCDGPLGPVPFDGSAVEQGGAWHRLEREPDGTWVLRGRDGGDWMDLYAGGEIPAQPIDYVVANHFTSTWPESPFVKTLTAQRATLTARHVLRGRVYTRRRGSQVETRELGDDAILALLRDPIGLEVDAGEVRAALSR